VARRAAPPRRRDGRALRGLRGLLQGPVRAEAACHAAPVTPTVADVAAALRRVAGECGEDVLPGASDEEIAALVRRVAGLGATVPADHLALLRDQDGFEADGLRVFGTTARRLTQGAVLPAL